MQSVWIDWKLHMNLASLKALCVAIVVKHHPKYHMPLIRTCILLQIGSQWKRLNKSLLLFDPVEQTIRWTTWQSPFNVTIINTFLANGRDVLKLPIYGTIVISSSYPPPQMTIIWNMGPFMLKGANHTLLGCLFRIFSKYFEISVLNILLSKILLW